MAYPHQQVVRRCRRLGEADHAFEGPGAEERLPAILARDCRDGFWPSRLSE